VSAYGPASYAVVPFAFQALIAPRISGGRHESALSQHP
jgi:hypothetical protein